MNCGRVSNQLSAYIDRELTGTEMLQIRSHLSDCDPCRAEHEALCRVKMVLGRLRTVEPPPDSVAQTVRRFALCGVWPSPTTPGKKPIGRDSDASPRLPQALAGQRAPLALIRPGVIGAQRAVRRLLGLIPWQPLTACLTTAALAAALICTSVVLHRPRHADTLVATKPVLVVQGQDPLNLQQLSDGAPGDSPPHDAFRDRLPDGQTSLPWVAVSLQGETSRPFR